MESCWGLLFWEHLDSLKFWLLLILLRNFKRLIHIRWTNILSKWWIGNHLSIVEQLWARERELLIRTKLNSYLIRILYVAAHHFLLWMILLGYVLFSARLMPRIREASFLILVNCINVIVFQKIIHQRFGCCRVLSLRKFINIWILVLSDLWDIMIEPLFSIFIQVLWKLF